MAKKTNSNKTDSKTNTVENAKQSLDELHGFLDQIMNSACAKQISKLKLALKQKEDECQQKDKEIAKLKKRIQLLTKGLTGEIKTCERDENSEEDIIKDDICFFRSNSVTLFRLILSHRNTHFRRRDHELRTDYCRGKHWGWEKHFFEGVS